MSEKIDVLFPGGYCESILKCGRFIIGRDFEAPGPAARVLPRVKIKPKKWAELWSFLAQPDDPNYVGDSDQEIYSNVVKELDFRNGVEGALNWYLCDCCFQAEIPKFRAELKSLRHNIENSISTLPDESSAAGYFFKQTFSGECVLRGDLKPSDQQLAGLQEVWQNRVGFMAMKKSLQMMLRNIEAAQKLLGKSKPQHHQVKRFVGILADTWKKTTGKRPKSGRDPNRDAMQSGPFADFVRATNDILDEQFRIVTLDRAIRDACDQAR